MAKKDKSVQAETDVAVTGRKPKIHKDDSERDSTIVKFTAEQRSALVKYAAELSETFGIKVGLTAAAQSIFTKAAKDLVAQTVHEEPVAPIPAVECGDVGQ